MKLMLPLLLALLAIPAWADLYKWTDASGQVHFSDKKPGQDKGVQTLAAPKPAATDQKAPPSGTDGASALERQKRMADILAQENAEREATAKAEEAKKKDTQRRCAELRDYQRRTDGRAVYQLDEHGERRFVDDKTRAEYDARVRKTLAEHCQ